MRPTVPQLILLILLIFISGLYAQESDRIYWEEPLFLDLENPRFPQAMSSSRGITLMAHEYEGLGGERGNAYVSLASSIDGLTWWSSPRILGPFPYAGEETPIASLLVRPDGTIYIAVAEDEKTFGLYRSSNQGYSFSKISTIPTPAGATVAPRLYANSRGELVLFVSRDSGAGSTDNAYLGISYSVSEDGRQWTPFEPLVPSGMLRETYLPVLTSHKGKDFVVFQAFKAGGPGGNPPSTYQLYLSESDDGGRIWGQPQLLSDFPEPYGLGDNVSWEFYDNQRPTLYSDNARLFLAWERKWVRSRVRNIYLAELDEAGEPLLFERFTSNRDSISPRLAAAGERYYLSWYEGAERDLTVRLAEGRVNPNVGIDWYYQQESGAGYLFVDILPDSSAFAIPVSFQDSLHMIWENDQYTGTELTRSSIVVRSPDVGVSPPRPRPLNFTAGAAVSQDEFSIAWNEPEDASGIEGYSYLFSFSPDAAPRQRLMHLRDEDLTISRELKLDGDWYFSIIARDYAGNWSSPARLEFTRDTTPPPPPEFPPLETDGEGFLLSNSLTLDWIPPAAEDVAGYTFTYTLLDPSGGPVDIDSVKPASPPGSILTREPEASFFNRDNGTWMISVAAVDRVGNVSAPAAQVFRLNKYVPVTIIGRIDAERDQVGRTVLTVTGRGFTAGGRISRILLDRDGAPPYDYSFPLEDGYYSIVNDRLITDFVVEDIEEGDYGLGLDHPGRGIKWSDRSLSFEASGVVKFGDFTYTPQSRFTVFTREHLGISVNRLLLILLLTGLGVAFVVTLIMIHRVVAEGAQIQRDVEAIVAGRLLTGPEYRERMEKMRRKGIGLRVKFVLLVTVLILIVVLMVAVSLGFYMIESRQQTLAEGLRNRSALLLESLAVGAQEPIDTNDLESIQSLVAQIEAMQDATGVIITGRAVQDPQGQIHALWAASDPEELIGDLEGQIRIDYRAKDAPEDTPRQFALIDSEELDSYRDQYDVQVTPFYGRSLYTDALSPAEEELVAGIDSELSGTVSRVEADIRAMQREQLILESINRGLGVSAEQLTSIRETFPEYENPEARNARLSRINEDIVRFNRARREMIRETGNILRSSPEFSPENFDPSVQEYIFYRPIVGSRQGEGEEGYFYRGTVRLSVSTEGIREQIVGSRRTLITITAIVALVAALIGIAGALVLATIIIIPINRLIRGVEVIRDTQDKEELDSHVIDTRTRDELHGLAQTINEMTQGLVQAAKANKELTLGKEVQKMFIPLNTDSGGRKLTTGVFENEYLEVFGYYEGADALSGDYFDHIDLQNGYHAFIKCDVAGHGASASLIMVEVATIFTSYFRRYVGKKPNLNISELVNTINDLLEERQFRGRFAALIIGLMELKTGRMQLCHAGDNLLHIYEQAARKVVAHTLPEAPATGIFSRDLIDMKGGYQQVVQQLQHGDTVLFFTDGIEESHHRLRGADFQPQRYQDFSPELLAADAALIEEGYKDIKPEEAYEEFDLKRVRAIIEAAMHREVYILKRRLDLVIDRELVFDFTSLEGTTEEMVLAMVAVEKVFRLIPDPRATERDLIQVDRKIADFLRDHFNEYSTFFRNRIEDEKIPEYVWFSHLKEDEQDDDLTILVVRRK
jgi:serine phosphatase RsbU (regulator of sigma subunit)